MNRKQFFLLLIPLFIAACGGGGSTNTGQGNPNQNNPNPGTPNKTVDIAMSAITSDKQALVAGETISLSITVTNMGNSDATNITLSAFISNDAILSSDDNNIASTTIASLTAGASTTINASAIIPQGLTLGTYNVLGNITWAEDTNSSNNVANVAIQLITINSTSGGIGLINTGTEIIAFLPTGTGVVPVVVESTGANPQANVIRNIKSTPQLIKSQAANVTFNLDSCSIDGTKLVCIGYTTSKVAVFDIKTYLKTFNVSDISTISECNLNVTNRSNFSGGACFNCGVAVDPGDNRFVVSSDDGYRVVGYGVNGDGSCKVQSHYEIPINENFGFDSIHNKIIAAEYNNTAIFTKKDGSTINTSLALRIVNIDTNEIFTWDKTVTCEDLVAPSVPCNWVETDAVAIDVLTGIVVFAEEDRHLFVTIDTGQAVFDTNTKTFTAPHEVVNLDNIVNRMPGATIESIGHYLFGEAEFSKSLTVIELPKTKGNGGVYPSPFSWNYNSGNIPDNDVCDAVPGDGTASPWANPGDPHGLAVTVSNANGKSIGIIRSNPDKFNCIAVVDLEAFLNAPKANGLNQIDTNIFDLVQNNVITFVSF